MAKGKRERELPSPFQEGADEDGSAARLALGFGDLDAWQTVVSGMLGPETLVPTRDNIRTYGFALVDEVMELCKEIGWKPWKAVPQRDKERIADEFADVFAFLGLFIVYARELGISKHDLARAYIRKSSENIRRLDGQVTDYGAQNKHAEG
jgi:NTP pyrophosphatase (non-canonical NTP hydrolase)